MSQKDDFYVYEWYNVDTGAVFYIGKGRKDRYKNITQRNQYFKNYYAKYKCAPRIIKHSLSEEQAFELEKDYIAKYRKTGQCQCNLTDGGEGSTFPKDSWNALYQKLQYLHNVCGAMNEFPNEDDYSSKNLKTKSVEELMDLYEYYREYKDGVDTAKQLGLVKPLDGYDMKLQYEEIVMLTELISQNIAQSNKEFKEFLNCKDEIDFMCVEFDTDKFIGLMLANDDYACALIMCIADNLRLLKKMQHMPQVSINICIKSYTLVEDSILRIRCNTKEDKKIFAVDINIYDIVWGIIIYKLNKNLFSIIYEEILVAPIIK